MILTYLPVGGAQLPRVLLSDHAGVGWSSPCGNTVLSFSASPKGFPVLPFSKGIWGTGLSNSQSFPAGLSP